MREPDHSDDELHFDVLKSFVAEKEELAAIREGLESLDRGDNSVSLDEAFARLRAKYNIAE